MILVNGTYVPRSFPLGAWGWRALSALQNVSAGVAMVVTLISGTLMIGGAAVGITWHLSDAIDESRRANQIAIASVLDRLSSDEAKLATDEERLTYVEKDDAEHYAASLAWQNKVGGQTDVILQALADLKVQLALKANIRER